MDNFLEDTTRFVNQAIKFVPISKGLANKITTCNSTYTVRFGVRLRGDIPVSYTHLTLPTTPYV